MSSSSSSGYSAEMLTSQLGHWATLIIYGNIIYDKITTGFSCRLGQSVVPLVEEPFQQSKQHENTAGEKTPYSYVCTLQSNLIHSVLRNLYTTGPSARKYREVRNSIMLYYMDYLNFEIKLLQ